MVYKQLSLNLHNIVYSDEIQIILEILIKVKRSKNLHVNSVSS